MNKPPCRARHPGRHRGRRGTGGRVTRGSRGFRVTRGSRRPRRVLRRHRRAQQLLRLGRAPARLRGRRPGAGHVQRPLPGDRLPGGRRGRRGPALQPHLRAAQRLRHPRRHPAGRQDRLRDDDRHGRLALPAHQHVRPDPRLLRDQPAHPRRHPSHGRHRDHRRLRLLEAHLCLQRRRVRLPPEGGEWTWKDSVRYTSACRTIGGTSGSPVVDNATGKVVAVNNTGNEDGGRCTDNNPCEVAEDGTVTVREGINYGQQTYRIPACFALDNKLDLSRSGCALPKP